MADMNYLRAAVLVGSAVAALTFGQGCSCKEARPAAPVRVAQEPAPAPAEQPAGQAAAQPKPARQPGESMFYAPADYLNTAVITAPRHMKRSLADSKLTVEIKQFQASEGHWPATLQELEQWRGEKLPPAPAGTSYEYDPQTGDLSMVQADE